MTTQLFILIIKVKESPQPGMDLNSYLTRLQGFLGGYTNASKVIHKFKVTGEPRVIAIFEVANVLGLERNMAGLSRMGIFDVICSPLISYESFAKSLGVDADLLQPSTHELDQKYIYWLDLDIDDSIGVRDLLALWKSEAETILQARIKGSKIDLFKVIGQRKVHLFISTDSPEDIDQMCLNLPLMITSGVKVSVACRGLQHLEYYTSKVMTEQL